MQAIALQDMVSQPSECSTICGNWYQRLILKFYPTRPERAEALSPGKALKKVPNFKCRAYF